MLGDDSEANPTSESFALDTLFADGQHGNSDIVFTVEDSGCEGNISLREIFEIVYAEIELALGKSGHVWPGLREKIKFSIRLHDIFLSLRHWRNDVHDPERILEELQSDFSKMSLSYTLRTCLNDVKTSLFHLKEYCQSERFKENPSAEGFLLSDLEHSVQILRLQVKPLRAYWEAKKRAAHMNLRTLRKIPYMVLTDWLMAIKVLGATWDGAAQAGTSRIGTYNETWMNLLLIFGAENIVSSEFLEEFPIRDGDLPPDVTNPFAMELELVAVLVGLAGCDVVTLDDNLPTFSGGNATLECSKHISDSWIGHFLQRPGLPAYLSYSPRTLAKASMLASGIFFYKFDELVPLLSSLGLPPPRIIRDLEAKRCQCESMTTFTANEWTGIRVSALALLAADTPNSPRIFPTKSCRISEAANKLSNSCPLWSSDQDRTVPTFWKELKPAIRNISFISEGQLQQLSFWGDRCTQRVVSRGDPTFLELGYSWLASPEDYSSKEPSKAIKTRPAWSPLAEDADLHVLEDAIRACDMYLRSGNIEELCTNLENKAQLHTDVSCQLQEVDWWLGAKQAVAACETTSILWRLSQPDSSINTSRGSRNPTLTIVTERRAVHFMLVFRAILLSVLLEMGLDNSAFKGTDLGKKVVLLR